MGFLGSKIVQKAPKNFRLWLAYKDTLPKNNNFRKVKLILQDFNLLEKQINKIKPQIIIHAARIDPFEENPAQAMKITNKFTKIIRVINAKLIYISSDAVFDGKKGNYTEKDLPNPVTDYGRAKLVAEQAIKKNLSNFVIIRTSYIYGKSNNKWDKRTLKLIEKFKSNIRQLFVFTDMYRSPILVDNLADACWKFVNKNFSGIIHIAGQKKSIFEFNREMVKRLGINPNFIKADSIKKSCLNVAPDTSLNTKLAKKIISFLPNQK